MDRGPQTQALGDSPRRQHTGTIHAPPNTHTRCLHPPPCAMLALKPRAAAAESAASPPSNEAERFKVVALHALAAPTPTTHARVRVHTHTHTHCRLGVLPT